MTEDKSQIEPTPDYNPQTTSNGQMTKDQGLMTKEESQIEPISEPPRPLRLPSSPSPLIPQPLEIKSPAGWKGGQGTSGAEKIPISGRHNATADNCSGSIQIGHDEYSRAFHAGK